MDYAIEPASLATQILSSIDRSNLEWEKSKLWTITVKDTIYRLLHKGKTEVIYTRPEENLSEFLLDIVAWDRESGEGLILACECEWLTSPKEVIRDFEKLLVIKSSLKLMIFASSGTPKAQAKILDAIKSSLMSYKHHVLGEKYIFIDFAKAPQRAAFWLQVNTDGRMLSIPRCESIVGVASL